MKNPTLIPGRSVLLSLFLLVTIAMVDARAQNYWEKIPVFPTECYSEKDDFGNKVQLMRSEIKAKLEKSKQAIEDKASKMTNEERMAMATKYQKMTPDEIVKMQSEMMEITQAQSEFQQNASEIETRFNQLESDFRSEFAEKLGSIEAEYHKLPDGEGTPQWAVKKGEELMTNYNKVYESICAKYFTSSNAMFKTWLKDFNTFLLEREVPFTQKMMKMEYGKFGLAPDESVAGLMAAEKYLEKCALIFNLRKSHSQG